MNYIPPVQLCLEKGSIRDVCFHGVSCRNYSFEQCHCRDKLAGRVEAEAIWVTPGQLDPPRASGSPLPSRRSQCRPGRARLAGLGAERGCSGTAPCIACSCSDNALISGTVRRESTHFIKARAGWWLSEAQTWAVCRETAGEAQVKVNYGCEFPLQPIKPTEPRKYLKAGTSGLPTESF